MITIPNAADIVRWLRPFIDPGTVRELRILDCEDFGTRKCVMLGYFDSEHLNELAEAALAWTRKASGCYVTMNSVVPDLLARAANRIIRADRNTSATSNEEIVSRRRLVIDFDPVRVAKVSATDAEKALASQLAATVTDDLRALGGPEPMLADSGNGYHANYLLDLPADDGGLVKRFLASVSTKYSTPTVKVDIALIDPNRIIKLYGTWSRKGDSIPDRPHRLSHVITAPEVLEVFDRALLESFIVANPAPVPEIKSRGAGRGTESRPRAACAIAVSASTKAKPAPSTDIVKSGDIEDHVLKPGDDYSARTSWPEILEPAGWKLDQQQSNGEYRWTRPGKNGGTSATTGHSEADNLHIFTSGDPLFLVGENYTKFGAYTRLEHGGDYEAAAKALAQLGYGAYIDDGGAVKQNPRPPRCPPYVEAAKNGKPREDQSHAAILKRIAAKAELFKTPAGDGYVTITVSGRIEHHPVESRAVELWLTYQFMEEEDRAPSPDSLSQIVATMRAKALFSRVVIPVGLRVAADPGYPDYLAPVYYIDLADEKGRAVKVSAQGWEVVTDPPVKFRRPKGMGKLPDPERGGSLDDLWQFVNIEEDDRILLIASLTHDFLPVTPHPIKVMAGEQGSCKSTTTEVLKRCVDPSRPMLGSPPADVRDLVIIANNTWVVAFDNLSRIYPWLSDALCRLAYGTGFQTRTLCTNDELTAFENCRPVTVNGIDDLVTRGDLLSRALILNCPVIEDENRRADDEFWLAFEKAHPRIFGALLDAIVGGLAMLPNLGDMTFPRMATFGRWGEAVSRHLGKEADAFLDAFLSNQRSASAELLEDSPLAEALVALGQSMTTWNGTSAELLTLLADRSKVATRFIPRWPRGPRSLSCMLRRLAPALRKEGIAVTFAKRLSRARLIALTWMPTDGG